MLQKWVVMNVSTLSTINLVAVNLSGIITKFVIINILGVRVGNGFHICPETQLYQQHK